MHRHCPTGWHTFHRHCCVGCLSNSRVSGQRCGIGISLSWKIHIDAAAESTIGAAQTMKQPHVLYVNPRRFFELAGLPEAGTHVSERPRQIRGRHFRKIWPQMAQASRTGLPLPAEHSRPSEQVTTSRKRHEIGKRIWLLDPRHQSTNIVLGAPV